MSVSTWIVAGSLAVGLVTAGLLYLGIRLASSDGRRWVRAAFAVYSMCVVFASIILRGRVVSSSPVEPDALLELVAIAAWAVPPLAVVFGAGRHRFGLSDVRRQRHRDSW